MIKLQDVKKNEEIKALIITTDKCLDVMKYTEHGERHASYVSVYSGKILKELGYSERLVELALIAGYLHDVGNAINRLNHGITGALLVYPVLVKMGMPLDEVNIIIAAIGNHEEQNGNVVNEVSAAIILADKSDAHRTRVRKKFYNPEDIHDRVNFSIKKNIIEANKEEGIIYSRFYMNNTSSVMEFFEIYLSRIIMSEKAAEFLGTKFRIYFNDVLINGEES